MRRLLLIPLLILCAFHAMAQQEMAYEDKVYRPEIKTVQFYNLKKAGAFPIITLSSNDQLLLAFDDLSARSKYYNYTLEHCDAQWRSSRLSPAEYLQSFTEDRIMDYRYSTNTRKKYIHYELTLPNQNVAPKLAGNYLLKVYEDNNQSKPVLTRRMYVMASRVSIFAEVVPSLNIALRETNQKINLTVDYAGLNVQNPYGDIKAFIMQNARPETGMWDTRPTYIRGTQLIYSDNNLNDFPGRNEFRHFDTRTLLLNSDRVGHIYRDTAVTITLLGDPSRNQADYSFMYDNNGNFFPGNQDGRDVRVDGDYAHMYFYLATNKTGKDGSVYITGKFNDWRLDASNKLDYDDNGRFSTHLLLKQGVYDYEYVWVDAQTQKPDDTVIEGSHFETENDYQVLVYYRPAGARWDELVGYRMLNTGNRR